MRQEFVSENDAKTEKDVLEICPWACEVVEVEGGWRAFESADDAATWNNQN
jgi:hypothetical protein